MQLRLRIGENTALDCSTSVRELLESYDEITIDQEISKGVFLFSLYSKQFLFFAPSTDVLDSNASVFLYNDSGLDIPHILLYEKTIQGVDGIPDGNYRWICLYEQESIVASIASFEDKILDTIDRLIELLSMTETEQEHEFQKEFMYYWNGSSASDNKFDIYLNHNQVFSELGVFYGDNKTRIIDNTISLSDLDIWEKKRRRWIRHIENDAFYIPIEDCRGIIPPHKGYGWTIRDVERVLYDYQINHISHATSIIIRNTIPKTQNLILVFGMHSVYSNSAFALKVNCKFGKGHSLFDKITNDGVSVEPLFSTRKDFLYMNEQIGNTIGLINKKITIIGAGSLGSYVASELVKNGALNIRIYDDDILEDVNVLRWFYGGVGIGKPKVSALSDLLNSLHPEIKVESVNNKIDEKELLEEITKTDLLIFTIGSSDQQIKFNRVLKRANCSIPVIYVWLEAGGESSHLLVVNYQERGCYECLFTDEKGCLVNNRGNSYDDNSNNTIIRNGCGGTRAAYGTATILRTTAALLVVIRKTMSEEIKENVLIDISAESVRESETKFPEEACACCGNRNKQ